MRMIGSDQSNGNNTKLIDQQSLVSLPNAQNSQMTSTVGAYEDIPPTSVFNLTDRLPIFEMPYESPLIPNIRWINARMILLRSENGGM